MTEDVTSPLKSAAKGTALVFSGMLVSHSLMFAIRLLIVRNLSREDLGIYSLSLGIASVVSLLASLGLWEGATRYISIFIGQDRKEDAEAVQRSSLRIGIVSGTAVCAAVFLLSGVLSRHVFYKPELGAPLMVMSFFIPAQVIALIIASVLRGYGIIRYNVYFMDIGQPLLFFVFLCLIFFLGLPFISVIYAYVFSMMMVCVILARYGYMKTEHKTAFRGRRGYAADLMRFSVPVLSIDLMYILFRWTDTMMLGRYASAEDVGVYSVSVSLATMLSLPLLALGYAYMPIAGELSAKNRRADLSRTYQVLTKWIVAGTLPVFFILFFFPEMTVTFLFGERFADSALPLRILSLGYLVNAFMGTNSLLLLVFGLSKAVVKVSATGALLNVLLNYTLVKHLGMGITGAATSTMVSLVAISIGYSLVLYRHKGIHPVSSGYLKPVAGSALIGVVIYATAKSLPLYFWMLPLYFFLYIAGYLASLLATRSLDDEDVFLLREFLLKAGIGPDAAMRFIRKFHRKESVKEDGS